MSIKIGQRVRMVRPKMLAGKTATVVSTSNHWGVNRYATGSRYGISGSHVVAFLDIDGVGQRRPSGSRWAYPEECFIAIGNGHPNTFRDWVRNKKAEGVNGL